MELTILLEFLLRTRRASPVPVVSLVHMLSLMPRWCLFLLPVPEKILPSPIR
jgi:hypothetical protein